MTSVLGKYWSSSLFRKFKDQAKGKVRKLEKQKNETNIFPIWTKKASSIRFLL